MKQTLAQQGHISEMRPELSHLPHAHLGMKASVKNQEVPFMHTHSHTHTHTIRCAVHIHRTEPSATEKKGPARLFIAVMELRTTAIYRSSERNSNPFYSLYREVVKLRNSFRGCSKQWGHLHDMRCKGLESASPQALTHEACQQDPHQPRFSKHNLDKNSTIHRPPWLHQFGQKCHPKKRPRIF